MGLWNWSGPQDLDWASAQRSFPNVAAILATQPRYKHEIVLALDTGIKYQGDQPYVGGWVYATGLPIPLIPAVNDAFTKVLLEFNGDDGSIIFPDTNAGGIPKTWSAVGPPHVTAQEFLFGGGSCVFNGVGDVRSSDISDLAFGTGPFTIRGWFKPSDPLGVIRGLIGMGVAAGPLPVFFVDKYLTGQMRGAVVDGTGALFQIFSTTIYSDTVNNGWHEFKFIRTGNILRLFLDNVQEGGDLAMTTSVKAPVGLITIGQYGQQVFSQTWKGWVDRIAVDVGVAR